MSDAKHTPGEWIMDQPGNWQGLAARIYVREPYGLIATVEISGWKPRRMAIANAHLIAAAPELLAACEAWDTGFVDGEQFDAEQFRVWVNERRAMARAAIAKAKGGAA